MHQKGGFHHLSLGNKEDIVVKNQVIIGYFAAKCFLCIRIGKAIYPDIHFEIFKT